MCAVQGAAVAAISTIPLYRPLGSITLGVRAVQLLQGVSTVHVYCATHVSRSPCGSVHCTHCGQSHVSLRRVWCVIHTRIACLQFGRSFDAGLCVRQHVFRVSGTRCCCHKHLCQSLQMEDIQTQSVQVDGAHGIECRAALCPKQVLADVAFADLV